MCHPGAGTVPRYGQKLCPWEGTWVPFLRSEFSQQRWGWRKWADGVFQLEQGQARSSNQTWLSHQDLLADTISHKQPLFPLCLSIRFFLEHSFSSSNYSSYPLPLVSTFRLWFSILFAICPKARFFPTNNGTWLTELSSQH